ncbi:hypothetical protein UY3_09352 [Chelonia mydas]|uniref:Uncharacterized protein n=1 Tax=Chelonia mydas TaxID=8469 RepID=M7BZG6_CHEMY|nr:hypothetical protein UY3_09352 [Chelonia mydas]
MEAAAAASDPGSSTPDILSRESKAASSSPFATSRAPPAPGATGIGETQPPLGNSCPASQKASAEAMKLQAPRDSLQLEHEQKLAEIRMREKQALAQLEKEAYRGQMELLAAEEQQKTHQMQQETARLQLQIKTKQNTLSPGEGSGCCKRGLLSLLSRDLLLLPLL